MSIGQNIFEKNKIYHGDCLEVMKQIPNKTISLIFADLPYKVTDCNWDVLIDLPNLWDEYKRILKPNGVVLLYATQPFATELINSNPKWFKYDWVWIKTQAANFQLAKKMPLKKHEYILVFYGKKPTYNPQMWKGEMKMKRIGNEKYQDRKSDMYLSSKPANLKAVKSDMYYPTTILNFPSVARNKSLHPTQKSVELGEFLIKTYTNEGELVLDNTAGSSTTAISCIKTKREWIMIEKEEQYYNLSLKRVGDFLNSFSHETSNEDEK